MDISGVKKIGIKNMVLLLIAGILLLICTVPDLFGQKKVDEKNTDEQSVVTALEHSPTPFPSDEERLAQILSKTEGVGKTEVMILYKSSKEIVPFLDEKGNLIQAACGEEEICIKKTNAAEVEGIVIVAEGAGKVEVMQYISDAAEALFGIPKHKIIVLPMRIENGSN